MPRLSSRPISRSTPEERSQALATKAGCRVMTDGARAIRSRALPTAPAARPCVMCSSRSRASSGSTAGRAETDDWIEPARLRRPGRLRGRWSEAVVARFLDNACPDHHVRGGSDHVRARAHGDATPGAPSGRLRRANFYTAVVCGDLDAVSRALGGRSRIGRGARTAWRPGRREPAVEAKGISTRRELGPKGLGAALVFAFTRLPLPSVTENAVAIARASWTMVPIPTSISWPAAASTRRSSARSAKAKRAGRRISSGTRSCGCCSSGRQPV